MTTHFPSNTRALLARSPFGADLEAFALWLADEGYSPFVTQLHLLQLVQVLPRLAGPNYRADELHSACVAVANGMLSRTNRFNATEQVYKRFLAAHNRLIKAEDTNPYTGLCAAYECHLRELRGLSPVSCMHHAATVADFLARGIKSGKALNALTPVDIEHYIALRSREMSRHSLQHVVAYMRSFLRYCHDQGKIDFALDAIETPRTFRDELPPRALDWSIVQALIQSVDLHSKAGWRDHCILHLLAHYGLRPSEVVALRLDSINWDSGVLHVVQSKTRTDLLLPLAPQTLQILRRYLAHDRLPQGLAYSELFLRARCPTGALLSTGVGNIFEKRMRMANLPPSGRHVYRLRHTFAMRLLTQGVGVKLIGDLLGHRSLECTCTYLRLDIDTLRGVALEVPEMAQCQGGGHA